MKKCSDVYLEDIVKQCEMVDNFQYQYFKGLKNRRIILNGEICADTIVQDVLLPLIDMDDGSGKEIELIVNSPGGDVISTFRIIDVLDTIKTPVHIKALVSCQSAALYLMLGGKNNPNVRTSCSKNTVGLLHSGSVGLAEMDANAADDVMNFFKKYDAKVKELVLSRTTLDLKTFNKMSKKEWYMFGDELVKYGFIDKLEETEE